MTAQSICGLVPPNTKRTREIQVTYNQREHEVNAVNVEVMQHLRHQAAHTNVYGAKQAASDTSRRHRVPTKDRQAWSRLCACRAYLPPPYFLVTVTVPSILISLFGKIQLMLVLSFRREAQTLAIGIHPTSNYTIVISVFYSPR